MNIANRIRSAKWGSLFVFFVANLLIALRNWPTQGRETAMLILLVAGITPAYIFLVHVLDEKWSCLGLRCLRRYLLPGASASDEVQFRRTLRLQMLAISSGFAATLFFLSVQLHVDLDAARRPPYVVEAMSFLFFFASLFNLLQIILYDFKLVVPRRSHDPSAAEDPWVSKLRERLDRKLDILSFLSWHALVVPVVLAFALIAVDFSIVVNFLYGLLLFLYYFFPIDRTMIEKRGVRHIDSSTPEASGDVQPAPAPTVGTPSRIEIEVKSLRT